MIGAREAMVELLRRKASRDLLAFMQYCWWMPSPLRVGRHTRALCARLTRAVEDWLEGRNTYLVVNMPFRHGKSDIVSRALPAYFIGRCAEREPNVLMSGYGSSLVKGFSAKVRDIVQGEAFRKVFPGLEVDREKSAADEWKVKDSQTTVYAQGLGGSITGKGGNLIIVDDYCKNREEAESKTLRDKMFESFRDDFCSRTNAPAHIIVVCATRWHEDDIVGRIFRKMKEDPGYIRWETMVFPARKDGPDGWDTLFPELYGPDWYDFQRRNLGPYSAAALLDCEPRTAGTAYFRAEWLQYYTTADAARLKIMFFVDGAKSKGKASDYTCILVIGKAADGCAYLLDGVHARLNLAEKIDALYGLRAKWPTMRTVWWEQVGPMSDVEALRMEMDRRMDRFTVRELKHTTAKDFRIRRLVVPFSQGKIVFPTRLLKTRLLADGTVETYDLVKELVEDEYLPYSGAESTEHDDMIDCLADICDDEVAKDFTPPGGGIGAGIGGAGAKAAMARPKSRFDR